MAHQNLTAGNCFEQPQVKTQNSEWPNKLALWFSVWERNKRPSFIREHFSYPESRDSKMKDAIVGEKWNSTTFNKLAEKKSFPVKFN